MGAPPAKLSLSREGPAVVFDVRFGRFPGVVQGMLLMSVGELCVMRCRFVFACFVILRGFLVVSRRVLVMFCCLVVMFCRLL